jgi:hypothetical protein
MSASALDQFDGDTEEDEPSVSLKRSNNDNETALDEGSCVHMHMLIEIHAVCMYMDVCMYVCIYVCMQICIYLCMYVCMYTFMYMYIYICMYIYTYVGAGNPVEELLKKKIKTLKPFTAEILCGRDGLTRIYENFPREDMFRGR